MSNELTPDPSPPILPEFLNLWQDTLGWQPTPFQQQQFQQLYASILAGNRQLNLTRITEPVEFWEKHLWDSLIGIAAFLKGVEADRTARWRVIDIGTGAGFPGLPIAIARADWQLTLLDSTRKKIIFLDAIARQLHLDQVETLWGRAEVVSRQANFQSYDLATIRAVGSPQDCAAYALPCLKPGGLAILYRGQWSEMDNQQLQAALTRQGGRLESIQSWITPCSQSVRTCVYVRKH